MISIRSCASTEMIVDAVQPTHPSYPTVSLCLLFLFRFIADCPLFWQMAIYGMQCAPNHATAEQLGHLAKTKRGACVPCKKARDSPITPQDISLPMVHAHAPLSLGITRPWRRGRTWSYCSGPPNGHSVTLSRKARKMGRSMAGGKSFNNQSKLTRKQK